VDRARLAAFLLLNSNTLKAREGFTGEAKTIGLRVKIACGVISSAAPEKGVAAPQNTSDFCSPKPQRLLKFSHFDALYLLSLEMEVGNFKN
jgi:hypothetical protein